MKTKVLLILLALCSSLSFAQRKVADKFFENFAYVRASELYLEAANDEITADELIDALIEVEPSFGRYIEHFKSLPLPAIAFFITTIIALIGILLAHQANALSGQGNDIARQQLELSREQFEYQKKKDSKKVEDIQATKVELQEKNKRTPIFT